MLYVLFIYKYHIVTASKLLEELYQREVVQKQNTEDSVKLQVAQLLHEMHEEQKSKVRASRMTMEPLFKPYCAPYASSEVVYKASIICLRFIEFWAQIHNGLEEEELKHELCKIMDQANNFVQEATVVAEAMKDHISFLLDEDLQCS